MEKAYEEYFFDNDASKEYFKIIETAKQRNWTKKQGKELLGYVESHHILPKSLMPNNNLVVLTTEEHYLCHKLLLEMVKDSKHLFYMKCAFVILCYSYWSKQERHKQIFIPPKDLFFETLNKEVANFNDRRQKKAFYQKEPKTIDENIVPIVEPKNGSIEKFREQLKSLKKQNVPPLNIDKKVNYSQNLISGISFTVDQRTKANQLKHGQIQEAEISDGLLYITFRSKTFLYLYVWRNNQWAFVNWKPNPDYIVPTKSKTNAKNLARQKANKPKSFTVEYRIKYHRHL